MYRVMPAPTPQHSAAQTDRVAARGQVMVPAHSARFCTFSSVLDPQLNPRQSPVFGRLVVRNDPGRPTQGDLHWADLLKVTDGPVPCKVAVMISPSLPVMHVSTVFSVNCGPYLRGEKQADVLRPLELAIYHATEVTVSVTNNVTHNVSGAQYHTMT